jgi:hypothetical protein
MTRRDLLVRSVGLLAMTAGWGACFWLRALTMGAPHDATMLEFGLVLASFVLTLGGLTAILGGARLLDMPAEDRHRTGAPHRPSAPFDNRALIADVLKRRAARRHRR